MREILLVEPPYRNKYPPIGLMKISAYHKMLGDKVTFIKEDIDSFVIGLCVDDILLYFLKNDLIIQSKCNVLRNKIKEYIVKGNSELLEVVLEPIQSIEIKYDIFKKIDIYRKAKVSKRLHEFFFWDRSI